MMRDGYRDGRALAEALTDEDLAFVRCWARSLAEEYLPETATVDRGAVTVRAEGDGTSEA
jgi:hypothetical protein